MVLHLYEGRVNLDVLSPSSESNKIAAEQGGLLVRWVIHKIS